MLFVEKKGIIFKNIPSGRKNMKIICLGDVVGEVGLDAVKKGLPSLIKEYDADFVVVNGENANKYNGISADDAEELRYCGADVITTGNHVFRQRSVYSLLDEAEYIIRPANYPSSAPGTGYTEIKTPFGAVAVINLMGQVNVDEVDNPFATVDALLKKIDAEYIIVDMHAETTSEKRAMGFYLDGKVSVVFGTHTHVQTADEQFLPKGTAYITDLGMCGAHDSVLGIKKECVIEKFRTRMPAVFEKATENVILDGLFVDTDNKMIERIGAKIQ